MPALFIHPIVLHFPIALLTFYGVLEIISVGPLKRLSFWFPLKAVLVIIGTIAGVLTAITGEMAAKIYSNNVTAPIIAKHELFAKLSIIIFGVLALAYAIGWIKWQYQGSMRIPSRVPFWKLGLLYQKFVLETPAAKLLALAGIVSLMITGALGGSMAFGSSADPLTNWIYHWFFQ